MEVVAVLRLLWRRRILVGVGAVMSVVLAVAMGHGTAPATGLAKTGVVIDTPSSQLVTDAPENADSLPWRATLLGMLLGTAGERAQMATEIGIPATQLAVVDAELIAPTIPASLPRAATKAAAEIAEPYVLSVNTDNVLPIVWIQAAGPDPAAAVRLAGAAVHALRAGAPARSTEELQGLSLRPVGAVHVRAIPGGPGRKKLLAVAVVLFGLWIVCLTAGPLIRGMSRTIAAGRALGT